MTIARVAQSLTVVVTILLGACVERQDTAPNPPEQQKAAARVVTLSPHLAELVFAVGAGDSLVGVSAYTDYPQAATTLPRVGDSFLIDHERLAILQPDLLLAWASGTPAHVVDELRAMGYRVEAIRTRGLEDVERALETVGSLTGHAAEAQAAAAKFSQSLESLSSNHAQSSAITVFYQISAQPLYTVNGDHFVSELIELCGGSNIFADLGELAPLVSVEAVLQRNPEVMLAAGDVDHTVFADWKRWAHLRTNVYENYFLLPAAEIGRPTPRLVQAGEAMCVALDRARQKRTEAATK